MKKYKNKETNEIVEWNEMILLTGKPLVRLFPEKGENILMLLADFEKLYEKFEDEK